MLADLQSRGARVDGPKIAAKFGWRFGLQVEHIDRAHPALQVDDQERNVARRPCSARRLALRRGSSPLQQRGQRERKAERAGGADFQQIAAPDSIATGETRGHVSFTPAPSQSGGWGRTASVRPQSLPIWGSLRSIP